MSRTLKRLTWMVGPPAAGKSTWAASLREQAVAPRCLELAEMLHPLVDPSRPRKGMMRAKGLLIRAIREVELEPSNDGLPPLIVIAALVGEAELFPLSPGEEVLLLLPPREQWERQFLQRTGEPSPGSRPMALDEARRWYDHYLRWTEKHLPVTVVTEPFPLTP
jgi:hypothetical protein